jgi:hypothetical protein
MKGGNSPYMIQVAGDMNEQVAGPNGVLKYTPVSGGGLEQMAVPALLVLANNVAPKLVKRGGSSMKKSRGRRHGGRSNTNEGEVVEETLGEKIARLASELSAAKAAAEATPDNIELKSEVERLTAELTAAQAAEQPPSQGGNMLQQAIVPATLILASNMLGKKGMRKMSSFTKRRSSRRRNNRRKRVSRRFRRGPR